MDLTIAGIVLVSTLLHPLWNALIKREERSDIAYIGLVSMMIVLSFAHSTAQGYDLFAAVKVWPLVALSVMAQVLYGFSLIITLRHGDLSSYYPIVRSSPLFIVIVSVLFLGQRYSWSMLLGIACVLIGAFALQYHRGSRLLNKPRILMFSILAMCGTGIYSIVDARAVQTIEPPVLLFWVELGNLLCYLLIYRYFVIPNTSIKQLFEWAKKPVLFLGIGLICYSSYYLILIAYALGGEVAAVTSIRQISIPISVLIGSLIFHEGGTVQRLAASSLIVLGIIIII